MTTLIQPLPSMDGNMHTMPKVKTYANPEDHAPKRTTMAFLTTANWLNGEIASLLAPLDLSVQQLKILSIVHDQPDQRATVNMIRERMMDPMSNVSRLLNKLMDKGLLEKVRSQQDQRVVYIHIRPAGTALMDKGRTLLDTGLTALCKLNVRELGQLEVLLKKLRG
jgi:DNA-binding MarR family transcriptional regulator